MLNNLKRNKIMERIVASLLGIGIGLIIVSILKQFKNK